VKIFASITAYNEEMFLDYVLSCIHDYVDHICVIDGAMANVVENGAPPHSIDNTPNIVKNWANKSKKIFYVRPEEPPQTFMELGGYGLNLAKELKCDWYFPCGVDEIYPKNSIVPMRPFLKNCMKNDIMGVNVNMKAFAPDFWHWYDFYVPRFGRITPDCYMPFKSNDVLYWPEINGWQSNDSNAPLHVKKLNIDYPRIFQVFHYTCVGKKRIKFLYDFYKTYSDNAGADHYERYIQEDWFYFKQKCKEFKGKHPEIMRNHPLYNERLY